MLSEDFVSRQDALNISKTRAMNDCCDENSEPPNQQATEPCVPEGIVRTAVDREQHKVLIEYNPAVISDDRVREVAGRFDKCLMRLHGRACEACAMKFERKAEAIPGIRRATATFIGGVMSVTYDDALLTPEEVVEKVTGTGANVTPLNTVEESKGWFSEGRLEMIFTGVCFVSPIAGW